MPQPKRWTTNGLAIEFGINNKTMKKRLEGLEPVEVELGIEYYHLAAVWDHLLNREEGMLNASQEAAKLNRIKREKEEFKLRIEKREYVKVEEMERLLVEPIMNAKAKLLSLPTKLAPLVVAISDTLEAKNLIEGQVHEVLSEISNGSLAESLESTTEIDGE